MKLHCQIFTRPSVESKLVDCHLAQPASSPHTHGIGLHWEKRRKHGKIPVVQSVCLSSFLLRNPW